MNESQRYELYQQQQFERYERACKRCGECCGSTDGDPCIHLSRDKATGDYYCNDYEHRLGKQRTVSNKKFNCVPLRDIIRKGALRERCAYRSFLFTYNSRI